MQKVESGDLPISRLSYISTPENQKIAHFIEQNKKSLQKGHPIHLGTLVNIQGDSIDSNDLNFPKAYIAFTNTRLNECEAIIAYADKMNKKFQHRCLFLVIFTDESERAIQKACKGIRNKTWYFAATKNQHLLQQFNNTHVPAYYLLDANSKLMQVPAPEPQNFEP
jgi:hypothetical protein